MNYKMIRFEVHGDERGKLVVVENLKGVPFKIERVFWIFDTLPDQERGKHAHKEIEELIIAIDGACQFILDDGSAQKTVWLNRPDIGLYIGKNMWREMQHFSYGCKLMVLASKPYVASDYVSDYEEFKRSVNH